MENNSALSTEQRDAFRLDAELKQHAGTVVSEMIEVGKCLKEINERRLYEYLGTGSFAEYAEKAVGLKERAAYNYITAYKTYGAEGLRKYGELGITKLVALAQLNDADRAEMLESGEAAEISTRALNDRIKELKHETDQLRFENETLSGKLGTSDELSKSKTAEIEKLEAEKAELEKRLAEATAPVVATMTDEEKEEIRKSAEKAAKAEAKKEIDKLKAAEKESSLKLENLRATTERLKADADKLKSENAELQARAVKAETAAAQKPKPVISGSKEALKFCLEDIQQQFSRAVEIVGTMEPEEKTKFKAALVGISDKLKASAEGI